MRIHRPLIHASSVHALDDLQRCGLGRPREIQTERGREVGVVRRERLRPVERQSIAASSDEGDPLDPRVRQRREKRLRVEGLDPRDDLRL